MAKLKQIVLQFDDGTTHEVPSGYRAVYVNSERAKRAGERQPWDSGPVRGPRNPGDPAAPIRDMGKDDASSSDFQQPVRCYDVNGIVVCP